MGWFISPYLLAIGVAWLLAHLIKFVIARLKGQKLRLVTSLFVSGGMPSSHSATAFAVATVIGLRDGIQSGLFGLAVFVTFIIIYDAVKVRRSSGEQGLALRALIQEQKSSIPLPRAAQGHTPIEVIVGSILGGIVGTVVFLATL